LTVTTDDKIEISELLSRYNIAMDRNDVDGWLETWDADGIFASNFGEARGKKKLEELMNTIRSTFASGKRHLSSNIIVGSGGNGSVGVISYLTVIEARKAPSVIASGVYKDIIRKENDRWIFMHRRLEVDLVED
jgi:ketosteroid isomerase-like protein